MTRRARRMARTPGGRLRRTARGGPFVSFVTLGVGNLDRAVRFYGDILGSEPVRATVEMAFFDAGTVRLALLTQSALAREAGFPNASGRGGRRPGTPVPLFAGLLLSLNVERREDVGALLARAESAGGRIVRRASKPSWGGVAGVFADPDGFRWEVAWNPRLSRAGWARRRGSRRPARRSR